VCLAIEDIVDRGWGLKSHCQLACKLWGNGWSLTFSHTLRTLSMFTETDIYDDVTDFQSLRRSTTVRLSEQETKGLFGVMFSIS
jgi:hypothetical protein